MHLKAGEKQRKWGDAPDLNYDSSLGFFLGDYFFFPCFCPTAPCLHDLELLLAGSVVDVKNGSGVRR